MSTDNIKNFNNIAHYIIYKTKLHETYKAEQHKTEQHKTYKTELHKTYKRELHKQIVVGKNYPYNAA